VDADETHSHVDAVGRERTGDPKALVEGYFCVDKAAATVSPPGPLAKTLAVPRTPEATIDVPDQQWSRGGQSYAVAPGNAAPT
jgi:hypothetical protein